MTPQEIRIQKMKKAGIPMPITRLPISESSISSIPITAANADKFSKLQALKNGANKQQLQSLIKAKSSQTFEGIPEPKIKQRPNQQNQTSQVKNKVPIESFQPKKTSEDSQLSAIEAMFDDGKSYYNTNLNTTQTPNTSQPELEIREDGYGIPEFSPAAMIQRKRAEVKSNSPYMKYAVSPEQHQDANITQEHQNFDFKYMEKMMQEVAKKTISEVLNDYTEKNKDKLTYENVAKSKDGEQIIKTNGKYYKLVPVKIKK